MGFRNSITFETFEELMNYQLLWSTERVQQGFGLPVCVRLSAYVRVLETKKKKKKMMMMKISHRQLTPLRESSSAVGALSRRRLNPMKTVVKVVM